MLIVPLRSYAIFIGLASMMKNLICTVIRRLVKIMKSQDLAGNEITDEYRELLNERRYLETQKEKLKLEIDFQLKPYLTNIVRRGFRISGRFFGTGNCQVACFSDAVLSVLYQVYLLSSSCVRVQGVHISWLLLLTYDLKTL